MTTSYTAPRLAVPAYLVEHLKLRLQAAGPAATPVAVSDGWPGTLLERDHVWIDRVTGVVDLPFAMAGTKTSDDEFTVRVAFQAGQPGDSISDVKATVNGYFEHLKDVITEDVSLGDMPGVIHAVVGPNIDGPHGELTPEGAVAFVFAEVSVIARID